MTNIMSIVAKVRELANEDKVIYAKDIRKQLEGTSYSQSLGAIANELQKHGYMVNYAAQDGKDER